MSSNDSQALGPIFLTGASRSGTALVRSALNNQSRVYLAAETHYFDDLRPKLGAAATAPLSDEQHRRCQDYFLAMSHRPYGYHGDPEKGDITRAALVEAAQALGSGGDAYFQAFCQIQTLRAGKEIWGEKTPRHIYRIADMLERYPTARVVCMVRDARAVVASYRDWKNQGGFDLEKDPGFVEAIDQEQERARRSYSPLLMSLIWRSTVQAALQARHRFGSERVRIQQYEDLVQQPEATLRELCDWLGLAFEPAMLEVPMHNSSVSRYDERGGVSQEPMTRWRKKLSAREIAVIQSCCGSTLRQVGYEIEPVQVSSLAVAGQWALLPWRVTQALLANRSRMHNIPAYIWRRMRLAMAKSPTAA